MSFEELTPKTNASAPKPPVRVGMWQSRGATARPVVVIKGATLDVAFGSEARRFRILLGTAEDRHLLRIVADVGGAFSATEIGKAKGATFWRFLLPPDVARFPSCKIDPQEAAFEPDKGGHALTITLPPWAWDAAARKETEARIEKSASEPRPPPKVPAGSPRPAASEKSRIHHGSITVSLTPGEEAILFGGKETELNERQAKAAAALAKASPNPVSRAKLIEAIWGGRSPPSAEAMLDAVLSSLRQALPSIGLKIESFKGIGVAMREAA